jgi:hypothetical protein
MNDRSRIAFALGGLAGNNAHGAGFLQAALDRHVDPVMISCTSGQIYWAYQYLRLRRGAGGERSLRDILAREIDEMTFFHHRDLDLALLSAFGRPGRLRPAYLEVLADTIRNALQSGQDVLRRGGHTFLARDVLQMFPCRTLLPGFQPDFYDDISREFAGAEDVGIAFNSYSPGDGCEHVYLNPRARQLLAQKAKAQRFGKGERSSYRDRVTYQEVTPEAVRDGLWIYQYGFDGKENTFVDGAYFRDIMLSELRFAEVIYAVRPMHYHWNGHLPRSWPELADLMTKVAFNGAYAGERYQILLVNKLVKSGALRRPEGDERAEAYHHIDLHEVEVEKHRGFFDYAFESMEVFKDACQRSGQLLDGQGGRSVS